MKQVLLAAPFRNTSESYSSFTLPTFLQVPQQHSWRAKHRVCCQSYPLCDYYNTTILPDASCCPSYSAYHIVREGMTYPGQCSSSHTVAHPNLVSSTGEI